MAFGKKEVIEITPPNLMTVEFVIRGDSPYCQNKFSQKALAQMIATQAAGSTAKKGRKRDAKDFDSCYRNAIHRTDEGWYGIPAPAFRAALISACRMVGFMMTRAKLSLFCMADGVDCEDGTPLVRITKGEPHRIDSVVRNDDESADIRPRPIWDAGWEAVVRIRFDADQFTVSDVTNLMCRAGLQVGIGEGRPDSKTSAGCGWGTFVVAMEE